MNSLEYAARYDAAGFKLCAIAPGLKHPRYPAWEKNPIRLDQVNGQGLGLLHVQSRTCAIDVDDLEQASHWLESRGIDLRALLEDDSAVQIKSGRANRAKLLYKLPDGAPALATKKLPTSSGAMMLEFRCASNDGASVQDVLPPTIHPETKQPYQWAGNGDFENLPPLPGKLLALWKSLDGAVQEGAQPAHYAPPWGGLIPEGGRNTYLYKRAGDLAGAGIPEGAVIAALQDINAQRCAPPLPSGEVAQIARSAMTTSRGAKEAMNRHETGEPALQRLKPVSVVDVLSDPSPPPGFVWEGLIPQGVVTLLTAHGGTGKSTIALMLAVCAALGRPLFGVDVKQSKVLFASLEDGAHILRHRLAGICRQWSLDPAALHDRLQIVDGTENPELFVAQGRDDGNLTPGYWEMRALIEDHGIGLVIVDNASDAFAGDEIQRRQVRRFIQTLSVAVRPTNAGCLLLAHVDKTTSRANKAEGGEGYSGSTSWHNSARSRLFLSRKEGELLMLEHQKNNFGQLHEPIALEWPEHGLPCLAGGASENSFEKLALTQRGRDDDERAAKLLAIIAEFEGRGQYCSPSTTARNNVHALLRSEPSYQRLRLTAESCRRVVNQCQRAGWIAPLEYRTHDRKDRQRWTVTPTGQAIARSVLGACAA
jgi:hypothetical protein